jgi:hypothetical protein
MFHINIIYLISDFRYLKLVFAGEDKQDSFQSGAVFYTIRLKILFQLIQTFVALFCDFAVSG